MYWIGSHAAITAAEVLAAAEVVGRPEYLDGKRLPKSQWITERWAEPRETATPCLWAIPAFPVQDTPEGCTAADAVEWRESTE